MKDLRQDHLLKTAIDWSESLIDISMRQYPIQRETDTYRQTELPDCQIDYCLLIDRLMRDYVINPHAPLLCISGTVMIVNSISQSDLSIQPQNST